MSESKLLAYKPVLMNPGAGWIYSAANPEFVFDQNRIVTTKCALGHKMPVELCTCGVYTSLDFGQVSNYVNDSTPDLQAECFPVMGIFQVLGHTIVEQDKTLRSWGIYLWGLVRPKAMDLETWRSYTRYPSKLNSRYRPVSYMNIGNAHQDVYKTMQDYGILLGR